MKTGGSVAAREESRMVIGPWSHFPPGGRKFGPIDFGPAADVDLVALDIRWFDHWLKGATNGIEQDASVKIFVMGDNAWRDEKEWPPRRAQSKALFLEGAGRANPPAGDGPTGRRRPRETRRDVRPADRRTTRHPRLTPSTPRRR